MKKFYMCLNCERIVRQSKKEHELNEICSICGKEKTVDLKTAWLALYNDENEENIIDRISLSKSMGILILLVIAFFTIVTQGVIPSMKYNDAMNLFKEKKYQEAKLSFDELQYYSDSEYMSKECIYQQALLFEREGDLLKAYDLYESINDHKNSAIRGSRVFRSSEYLSKLFEGKKIGETIQFGNFNKKSIDWVILDKNEKQALVISKNVLMDKSYNDAYENVTWEKCTLRKWLNKKFLPNHFSKEQKEMFDSVKLENSNNSEFNTKGGKCTKDTLFLLSEEEVDKYLSEEQRQATDEEGKNTYYWLRTPGLSNLEAMRVRPNGEIAKSGNGVSFDCGIRPCLWITYKLPENNLSND